ncbi:D-alanyl-D-alanine carboxypeptidase family protein [Streptomyces sp. NBC_01508]|uniref:D-alanyl-D-alanine carboxypeptidase family protein n=1 Tax=Streptomyces sp. NBC_01508 TaxID=2903888 RepID=UPI00386D57A4
MTHESPAEQALGPAPDQPVELPRVLPSDQPVEQPPDQPKPRTLRIRPAVCALLALGLVLVIAVVQAVRPLPSPALRIDTAHASFTLPGHFTVPWPQQGQAAVTVPGSGSVGTHGAQRPVPIASVAKVMTAYVLLTERPPKKDETGGPMIEVDAKAVADGNAKHESRVEGLTVGQRFSQRDMLKMLMIPSGNNIARLLARWATDSDSEAAFVRKMNDAAKRLGMKDTTYTDPSGLDAKTVSTAVDQLKLAEAVMTYDAFRAVVALPSATVSGLDSPLINNMGATAGRPQRHRHQDRIQHTGGRHPDVGRLQDRRRPDATDPRHDAGPARRRTRPQRGHQPHPGQEEQRAGRRGRPRRAHLGHRRT